MRKPTGLLRSQEQMAKQTRNCDCKVRRLIWLATWENQFIPPWPFIEEETEAWRSNQAKGVRVLSGYDPRQPDSSGSTSYVHNVTRVISLRYI